MCMLSHWNGARRVQNYLRSICCPTSLPPALTLHSQLLHPTPACRFRCPCDPSSSMDWQVRPEAMMGFFTTVGGVSPPSLLRPGRRRASGVRARAPSPGAATARRGDQLTRVPGGERGPNPRELPSSGSGGGGDGGGALPDAAAGGGIDAAVAAAAARQRAAEMAQGARLSSDPGSVSSSSNGWNSGPAGGGGGDGEGVEGGGNSSWGW